MPSQHQLGNELEINVVDKRRQFGTPGADSFSHMTTPTVAFTANAGGSTTTLVGANATPGAGNVNVIRVGERIRLFTAGAVLPKEETVFTVTGVVVAGSTTVTFTPAAKVATVSTDFARLVDSDPYADITALDAALLALNGGASYTAARLNTMTINDKIWALRQETDKDGI